MTKEDASRIQSGQVCFAVLLRVWSVYVADGGFLCSSQSGLFKLIDEITQAKAGNDTSSDSFAARAQSAGDKNAAAATASAGVAIGTEVAKAGETKDATAGGKAEKQD